MSKPVRHRYRDFHRRSYGNPLFPSRSRASGGRRVLPRDRGTMLVALKITAIALLAGAAAWYLGWSQTFRITEVTVAGATPSTEASLRQIIDAQMRERRFLAFPQTGLFAFSTTDAADAIRGIFHLEDLSIEKRLPRSIVVTVKEIPKRAVLFHGGAFLAVSDSGVVIRELTERETRDLGDLPPDIASVIVQELGAEMVELSALAPEAAPEAAPRNKNEFPLLLDDAGDEAAPKPGRAVFSPSTLALILQATTRLPDLTGDAVRWFTVRERDEAIDVTMAGDWHLFLTTTLPFEVQGERLSLILRDKVGDDRPRLQYIDLRYNERIFIKLRDAEAADGAPAPGTP